MMKTLIQGKSIIAGRTSGRLVVSQEPFSFFGGFDFSRGTVVDPRSDIFGACLKEKIFAYPRGKGSSSTAGVILEALRQGVAPKAIINVESEKILAVGIIVAEVVFGWSLPVVSIPEEDYQLLTTGDFVQVVDGEVIISK